MPTGYTAKLMESGQSFPDFAMTCARAFGALIEMRDDRLDAAIPEAFKPSPCYAKALAKAKREAKRLHNLKGAQRVKCGARIRAKRIACYRRILREYTEQNRRIAEILPLVNAWHPPTSEHRGLKDFMIEQLTKSHHDRSWVQRELEIAVQESPASYFKKALENAAVNLESQENSMREEVARVASRNKWVADLRASLNRKDA